MLTALLKRYWLQLAVLAIIAAMALAINHYRDNAITYKDQRDKEASRAEASEVVTSNIIKTVSIINAISEANQHAKNQIALDSQSAQKDIRVAVAGDSCADRPVPAAAVKRLHDHASSLRESSGGATPSKPDI